MSFKQKKTGVANSNPNSNSPPDKPTPKQRPRTQLAQPKPSLTKPSALKPCPLDQSSISLTLDLSNTSLAHPGSPRQQLTFVDPQLLSNVFQSLKLSQNQSALVSIEKVVDGINELELCGRRLVSENARLFVESHNFRKELAMKEKSLQELSEKLTAVIEKMEQNETSLEAGFMTELSVLFGEEERATAEELKIRVGRLMTENDRLRKQVEYLQGLLMGKKHYQNDDIEKLIRKTSVAIVQRDSLQVKVHDLLEEVKNLKENVKEKQAKIEKIVADYAAQRQKQQQLSQATNDTPQITPRRPSKSQQPSPSTTHESLQIMQQRFCKIQQINKDLTQKLNSMSIQSEVLTTDLKNQLQEIQNMKLASQKREEEFESKLKTLQQDAAKSNKIVEKAIALAGHLDQELGQKNEALKAENEKVVKLQEENVTLKAALDKEKEKNSKLQGNTTTTNTNTIKTDLQAQLAGYEKIIRELQSKNEELIKRANQAETKVDEEKIKFLESQQKLSQAERRFTDSEKKYGQYQKKLKHFEQRFEDVRTNSEQNQSRIKNSINIKDNRIVQLGKEIHQLKEDLKNENKVIETLQIKITVLKEKIDQYETNIVPQMIKELEEAQSKLKQQLLSKKSLNSQKSDLTNHQMDRIMLNLSKELQKLKAANAQLTAKKSQLESELQKSKKQIVSLQSKIVNSSSSPSPSARYEHNTKQCLEQREQLKAIVLELERENSQYMDKIDDLELEIIKLKGVAPTTKSKIGKVLDKSNGDIKVEQKN